MKKILSLILSLFIAIAMMPTFNETVIAGSEAEINIGNGKKYSKSNDSSPAVYFDEYTMLDGDQFATFINTNSSGKINVIAAEYVSGNNINSAITIGEKQYDYYYEYGIDLYSIDNLTSNEIANVDDYGFSLDGGSCTGYVTYYAYLDLMDGRYMGDIQNARIFLGTYDDNNKIELTKYDNQEELGNNIGYYLTKINDSNYLVANVNTIKPIQVYVQDLISNNAKVDNVNCENYSISFTGFYEERNENLVYLYEVLVPYDIFTSNNNGEGLTVNYTFYNQPGQTLKINKNEIISIYDDDGNRYSFSYDCEEIRNIGVNFNINGNNYLRNEINSISNNNGIITYNYDVYCGNKNTNYTISATCDSEDQSLDRNSIVLNNSNLKDSIKVYEGGIEKKELIFTLKLDNSGSNSDYYDFKEKEFGIDIDNNEIAKQLRDNNELVYDVNNNVINIYSEEALRTAIQMLEYYNGGKIIVKNNITISSALTINHRTDSVYLNDNVKYSDEREANYYLVIYIDNGKTLTLNSPINIESYSKVAFVGSSKESSFIKGNADLEGALFNNGGYLQLDGLGLTSHDYALQLKDYSFASLWNVSIEGTNAGIKADTDGSKKYCLYTTDTTIKSSGYGIADLRDLGSTLYSSIGLERTKITSDNDVAFINKQNAYISFDECEITGNTSAIELYKGNVTFGIRDENHDSSVIKATNGSIIKVHYSENVEDIHLAFYDGYFNSGDSNSNYVIEEVGATSGSGNTSIEEIKMNMGVFIAKDDLFKTECTNFNLGDIVETASGNKKSYKSLDSKHSQYAQLSFSKSFIDDSQMYTFYKYNLDANGPYREENVDITSNFQYVVRTNKTIFVDDINEFKDALKYSNVNICLSEDLVNPANSNETIKIANPCNIYLHGHDIRGYTLEFDYPRKVNHNDPVFEIVGGFTDGGGNTWNVSTISNSNGPAIVVKDNVSIMGVNINCTYDCYGVVIENGARFSFSENSSYTGKRGFEVINSNDKITSLHVSGKITANEGYAIYAHNPTIFGGSNYLSLQVRDNATIEATNNIAIYTNTKFTMYMNGGLIKGLSGIVSDSSQPIDITMTGGKIYATGTIDTQDDNNFSTIRIKKKQDYYLSFNNSELISDDGYVFAFDRPSKYDMNTIKIYSGYYASGKDYIVNYNLGELKTIKGGYFNKYLLNSNQEELIANNFVFKQVDDSNSDYPYAVVRELKTETKIINGKNYSRNANDCIDTIGDVDNPVKFEIDEDSLLDAISDDDIKDYADANNNIDYLFSVKAKASQEGKTKFIEYLGTDKNLEYLDMSVRCLNNYKDIHKTNVYQTIKIDIPNGVFDGYQISQIKIKHYKNVNGVKKVVVLPVIDKEDSENVDFECAYIDGNSLIIITKDFSDYELVGTTSTINTVDASSLGELKGFYGDTISTINLPFGWEWKNKTEKISAEKELYFATNNGVEVGLHINASVKSDEINRNIETGNSVSGENYSEIVSDLLNNSTGNLLTEINNNAGKSVSMKPTLSIKDKNSQEVAADVNKVETNNITKDLTIGSVINIDLYMYYDGKKGNVPVTEISKPLTFTFKIPEEIRTPQSGYERRFYVVSVHNDNVSVLHSTTGNSNENISVGIDGFSNFMLCYKDYVISNNSGNDGYKYLNTGIN